jgi:hypothetical protein
LLALAFERNSRLIWLEIFLAPRSITVVHDKDESYISVRPILAALFQAIGFKRDFEAQDEEQKTLSGGRSCFYRFGDWRSAMAAIVERRDGHCPTIEGRFHQKHSAYLSSFLLRLPRAEQTDGWFEARFKKERSSQSHHRWQSDRKRTLSACGWNR